jgi:hypothetical protein
MKKAIILFVLALWPLSALAQAKKEGPKETLWAKVNLNVTWNKRNEDWGGVNEGRMNLSMSGTLKLNRDFSGKVDKGRFSPLLAYALQNATFNYDYKEDWSIIRSDNPPDCPNPQKTLQKTGSVSGDQHGAPMNLIIHYHKGLAEGASRLPLAPPPEAMAALIDYYEFVVLVPAQKAEGKSKVPDSKTGGCKEIDQSGPILDGQIEISFKIGADGKMAGSKSWTSQGLPHTFSVEVSDLPESFKKKPAAPKPWGKNDVHYTLTWDLDAAPIGQIEHETGGYWFDITGIDQDVVVGQKIHLKGLVAPRSMDTESGDWTIGDESKVKPILKFEASTESGHVLRVDASNLVKKEVTFFFTDEGESEVTYRTQAGGQDVTAKVKFKVKKPAFDLQADAQESNTYGPLELGEPNPSTECCVGAASDEERRLIQNCLEAKKGMATNPIDKSYYENHCPVGLQMNGITFTASPLDDTRGKVQFVQLVSRVETRQSASGGSQTQSTPQGLDGCYPFPQRVEYQAFDMPGFSKPDDGSVRLAKNFTYTMYLMFKPEGDENEWVPLKVLDWSWAGAIKCSAGRCQEDISGRSIQQSKAGRDTTEYPDWDTCSQTSR